MSKQRFLFICPMADKDCDPQEVARRLKATGFELNQGVLVIPAAYLMAIDASEDAAMSVYSALRKDNIKVILVNASQAVTM